MATPGNTINFGIALATQPLKLKQSLDAFCRALADATGLRVAASTHWHYYRLLEAMASGEVQFGWLPPVLALRASGRGRVFPIALPLRNGVASYSTALFCREDSSFICASDLDGVRAAWVDRNSAAGYLIIRAALRAEGISLEDAFSADQFHGAHDAVARAVLDGEADVGATFVHVDPTNATTIEGTRILKAGWGGAPVRVLKIAGPIPNDVLAGNNRVPFALIQRVQQALVDGPSPALMAAMRTLLDAQSFVRPVEAHLAPLSALLTSLGDDAAVEELGNR